MSFCYFAFFRFPGDADRAIADADVTAIHTMMSKLPSLQRGLVHLPAPRSTPHHFQNDEPSPALALQLYFADIEGIEAHLGPTGALQALRAKGTFPSLDDADMVQQQVMLARRFSSPGRPTMSAASYLVHYPGQPEDLNLWLAHYHDHHPGLMRGFPGIQEIELYTRVDWVGFVPGTRVNFFQRNKQVFANVKALSDAMLSSAITGMRADYHQFPPFSGGNVHYPMVTKDVEI